MTSLPTSERALIEKLSSWIGKTGYALEMRVAAAFQSRGFTVLQSDSYKDPDTDEAREIDVLAYKGIFLESFAVHLNFLIECKNSPDKPWVMFMGNDATAAESLVTHRITNGLGKTLLSHFLRGKERRDLLPPVANLCAYGVTEAFGNEGISSSHRAVLSATKAALAGAKAAQGKNAFAGSNFCEIFFPVVVVDGKLAHASLDKKSNQPFFTLTGEGTLIQRHPTGLKIVDIVEASALENYANRMSKCCDDLLARILTDGNELESRLRRSPDFHPDD